MQQHSQPGEDETEVVTDDGEDEVGSTIVAAYEVASDVADHELDGGAAALDRSTDQLGIGREGEAHGSLNSLRPTHSTLACLQTDSDFAGFIISELNAGPLKDVLYLEDRGEISFHDSFILLDPLEGRQPNAGSAGKLTLAPA